MEVKLSDDRLMIECHYGADEPYRSKLRSISKLNDLDSLVSLINMYCAGKRHRSVTSWLSRIISTLDPLIEETEICSLDLNSLQWQLLIKNWYGLTISTKRLKSSIETRVGIWNKNVCPFLEFMQRRDKIPIDVIIPKMKRVGQISNNSSFELNIIGDKAAEPVSTTWVRNQTLSAISLTRSDAEYLDELHFDLEKKREKLFTCLKSYWECIKAHYDYGKKALVDVDSVALEKRLIANEQYDYLGAEYGKPPIKKHIAKADSHEGFARYLYLTNLLYRNESNEILNLKNILPTRTVDSVWRESGFNPVSLSGIECSDSINSKTRIYWALGHLRGKDISIICALIIMLNPKFTSISLKESTVDYDDGKTRLVSGDHGVSFSINKERAKSEKKEILDPLSEEIIKTLYEMHKEKCFYTKNKNIKRKLFLSTIRLKGRLAVRVQSDGRYSRHITGSDTKLPVLTQLFPSIVEYDLGHKGAVSFSKIRNTEGVLEWFKKGSVRSMRRKLGNSEKVSLEHYMPKQLIALWSTRQIRRFQNLLIVAATAKEDYLIEASDFNSIADIHVYLEQLLAANDTGKNALINYLKEGFSFDTGLSDIRSGEFISSISNQSLAAVYLYKQAAIDSNINSEVLAEIDKKTSISPMAVIKLASHLDAAMSSHPDSKFRLAHDKALMLVEEYKTKLAWSDLMVARNLMS